MENSVDNDFVFFNLYREFWKCEGHNQKNPISKAMPNLKYGR